MSGKNQMEDMLTSWTKTQQEMWDKWMQSVRQFSSGGGLPGNEAVQAQYQEQLAAWEQSVKQALEAQAQWASKLSEQSGAEQQMPAAMKDLNARMQEMMKNWTQSQEKLWSAWFESMRTMDPKPGVEQWEEQSREVMEAWQQAAERAQETLQQWAKMAQDQMGGGR
ncbi:hypothetical protein M0534_03110 [Methylonatrum kenyense]|uniref:hypothetical protein n=1 Tax=Methylonatrum kenyense TaxID=455253 RepID=UPI0020BE7CD1|nr:hypothetical protein [Methylonatrum kenyense]MCK8515325.1 hypothetical protein [Methylonatrum kenyense]